MIRASNVLTPEQHKKLLAGKASIVATSRPVPWYYKYLPQYKANIIDPPYRKYFGRVTLCEVKLQEKGSDLAP